VTTGSPTIAYREEVRRPGIPCIALALAIGCGRIDFDPLASGHDVVADAPMVDAPSGPPACRATAFGPPMSIVAGETPEVIATADVDRDGNADLVVGDYYDAPLTIRLGNGDGTFGDAITTSGSSSAPELELADVNKDGIVDVVETNFGGSAVTVMLGDGDGTVTAKPPFTQAEPEALAIADVDEDGVLDLAISNYGYGTVTILHGNGDGTFTPVAPTIPTTSVYSGPIALADLDGDSHLDLMVGESTALLSVMLGHGDGTFGARQDYTLDDSPSGIVTADFDGDGKLDVAVTDYGSAEISVLRGKGDGTLAAQTVTPTNSIYPGGLIMLDVDRDGHVDLITGNGDGTATVLYGHGDGTFDPGHGFVAGTNTTSLAAADFNSDGIPDLALADFQGDQVVLLFGTCP
jgi:hypothetical protein